jgi:membrane fusion protein
MTAPDQEPTLSRPLFRPEAVRAQIGTGFGEITLKQPMSITILAVVAMGLAVVVVLFMFASEYTRRVRVTGWLLPEQGVLRVFPPQAGVVRELKVREGDLVAKGDLLFVLSSERATGDSVSTEGKVVALQRTQLASLNADMSDLEPRQRKESGGLRMRAKSLEAELRLIDSSIELGEQQLVITRSGLTRYSLLRKDGLVSELDLDRLKQNEIGRKIELETMRRERLTKSNALSEAQLELEGLPLQHGSERSRLERNINVLEQALAESEARREMRVVAPKAGRIGVVLISPGQGVVPAASSLHLLPTDSPLVASLYVPSAAAGLLKVGQRVKLRYPAFPFQHFGHQGGVVVAMATSAMRSDEVPFPLPGTEPVYRVQVELDSQTIRARGRENHLQAGMGAEADILLEKRRLIDWIFEPVRAAATGA